ncbi:MAG: hypothetical protein WDN25_09780 [Acetobacteraceae bacterium]
MPTNAYPELPNMPFQRTSVPMSDVIAFLQAMAAPAEVKRAAYIMFRNESANGKSGVNNNYVGAQADGGRWPAKFDECIVGTVTIAENQTGRTRIFVAFRSFSDSLEFLTDRVQSRGLFVGGTTHKVVTMTVRDERELARAYHKEWVSGSAAAEPSGAAMDGFLSMYRQASDLFPLDALIAA